MLRRVITPAVVWRFLATVLSGLLLACAFPLPAAAAACEGASAAWLALIPLLILSRRTPPRAAFAWGWFSGFLFWLVSLVWLLQLRHTWGHLGVVLLAWVALAAYCALYTGAFTALLAALFAPRVRRDAQAQDRGAASAAGDAAPGDRKAARVSDPPRVMGASLTANLLFAVAAPCVWVALEYLRAVLFTGFPWNALGVSQYDNLAVIQLAAFGGVYAVSALLVFVNAVLAGTALSVVAPATHHGLRRRLHPELMLALAACACCWIGGATTVRRVEARAGDVPFRVACVQPCIPQLAKWDPSVADDTYRTLVEQSRLALLSAVDLLVWPETAVPELYRFDPISQAIARGLVTNGVPLLLGAMDLDETGATPRLYNSAFLIDTNAAIAETYCKQHLVPFGEYLPFADRVATIRDLAPLGFSCVPGDGPRVFPVAVRSDADGARTRAPVAVLICFEDTIAALARGAVAAGARVLVNLTNDAWFDGSSATRQHMAHAVFRAVEQRVPLIRCTNTGMTCFITQAGRLHIALWDAARAAPLTGFTLGEVRVPRVAGSVYARAGDWALAIPAVLVTLGLFLLVVMRRKREDSRRSVPGG